MNSLPMKNGRPCVYRVVRVSGTIRKVEEEAIRRAKLFVLAAKEEVAGKPSRDALDALLRGKDQASRSVAMAVDDEDDALQDDYEVMSDDG